MVALNIFKLHNYEHNLIVILWKRKETQKYRVYELYANRFVSSPVSWCTQTIKTYLSTKESRATDPALDDCSWWDEEGLMSVSWGYYCKLGCGVFPVWLEWAVFAELAYLVVQDNRYKVVWSFCRAFRSVIKLFW